MLRLYLLLERTNQHKNHKAVHERKAGQVKTQKKIYDIQANTSNLIGRHFITQQDNALKHNYKQRTL